MTAIRNLLASARHKMGYVATHDVSGAVRHVHKQAAASVANHSLRALELPAFAADPLRVVHTPLGTEAGKRTKLSDAVLAGSRCAAAGARVVMIPTAADATTADNGEVIFTKQDTRFDVIEAAKFAKVADGAELSDSAVPIYRALVDPETMPTLGVRIPLSRAEQKSYADGQLADATLVSIALGIARAADATLLAAIAASNPKAFSLGSAAALGVEFAELRAIVGRDGIGAVVGQDGTLRAAGVIAELTPDTAATFLGSFSRAAIAVSEDISLIADRVNVNGDLVLTCFTNMSALLPLPGAFFTVGA